VSKLATDLGQLVASIRHFIALLKTLEIHSFVLVPFGTFVLKMQRCSQPYIGYSLASLLATLLQVEVLMAE
jgi:hypothetical protein